MSEGESRDEMQPPPLDGQAQGVIEAFKAFDAIYDAKFRMLEGNVKRLNYALGRSTNMLMLAMAMKTTTDPEQRAEMMKEIDAHLAVVQEIQSKIGFVSE